MIRSRMSVRSSILSFKHFLCTFFFAVPVPVWCTPLATFHRTECLRVLLMLFATTDVRFMTGASA